MARRRFYSQGVEPLMRMEILFSSGHRTKIRGKSLFHTVFKPVPRPIDRGFRSRFGSIKALEQPEFLWRIRRNSQVVHNLPRAVYFEICPMIALVKLVSFCADWPLVTTVDFPET
jgi:hypothetical protein